jgi:hypothetical protein
VLDRSVGRREHEAVYDLGRRMAGRVRTGDELKWHGDSLRRADWNNICQMGDHIPGWLETAAANSARVRTLSLRSVLDT